jgi:hypothetical protein
MPTPRGWHFLLGVMVVAVVSSAVHYTDNTINWAEYPHPEPGSSLPDPSDRVVGASWFAFTAAGLLGLWLYARGRVAPASVAIAVYSGSGLVSIGHYLAPGATSMPVWRQTLVIADIVLGTVLLGFALWAVLTVRPLPASPGTAR